MFSFIRFLKRLTPSRRSVARLGVFALLLHASLLGFHQPSGLLTAFAAAPDASCIEHQGVTPAGHEDETDHSVPGHAGTRCPFCTLVQGGKLLPPPPRLIFPPAVAWVVIPRPPATPTPPSVLTAVHRPRGPPLAG